MGEDYLDNISQYHAINAPENRRTVEEEILRKVYDIETRLRVIERNGPSSTTTEKVSKKKSLLKTAMIWPIQFAAKRYILSALIVFGLTTSGYWSLPEWENSKEVISYQIATGLLTTVESGIEKQYVNKDGDWFSYPNFEEVSDSYLNKVAESIKSVGPETRYPTKKKWWF